MDGADAFTHTHTDAYVQTHTSTWRDAHMFYTHAITHEPTHTQRYTHRHTHTQIISSITLAHAQAIIYSNIQLHMQDGTPG